MQSPRGGASGPEAALDDDPHFAVLALGEAIHLSRADIISTLIRKHGITFANEPLPLEVKGVDRGDTALHLACRLGKVDAVRTLLRAGVAMDARNAAGKMPLQLAPENGLAQQVEQCFMAELLQNVCSGQAARIERLLSSGLDASKTDGSPDEATLLHWAAAFGQGKEVVGLLVKAGADPNARNKSGSTPAHEASANGSIETLEALREAGADFSIKTPRGMTAKDVARSPEVATYFEEIEAASKGDQNNKQTSPSTANKSSSAPKTPTKTPVTTSGPPTIEKGSLRPSSSAQNLEQDRDDKQKSQNGGDNGHSDAVMEKMRRKIEEQEALIETLRSTVDGLLRDHGVHDYVQRLQEHVGALTRQLAATAEQRDKLQNLYVANDRELERLARELALVRSMSPGSNNNGGGLRRITSDEFRSAQVSSNGAAGLSGNADEVAEIEELREKVQQLTEELERERKEGYAAARMHLTYEADLRAEIKALQEQMLANEVGHAAYRDEEGRGFLASLLPW